MKSLFKYIPVLMTAALFIASCSKDPEPPVPPVEEVPTPNKTIADLRALVTGDVAVAVPSDFVFKGVVVSNQGESNNFYRAVYIQDGGVAIKLSCDKDGTKFYETIEMGREVIVEASGLYIGKHYDTYVLGSGPDDNYKVALIPDAQLISSVHIGDATTLTPVEINDLSTLTPDMVGTYVKVTDVQVVEGDRNKTLGWDDSSQYSDLTFTKADASTIQVSNNNYATFSDQTVPDGSGSISGILNTFGANYQIANTKIEDLDLTGARFTVENPGGGTGVKDDPYDAPFVLSAADDGSIKGWVKGYIIGTIPSTGSATLEGPFSVNTNMLIAASADETDVTKMVSVQLPSGAIREALNLVDNSANHKKEVIVLGSLEYYYGFKGVKSLTGYWIDGAGIDPDNRTEDAQTPQDQWPTGSFFYESFVNIQKEMDIYVTSWVNKAEKGNRVWIGKEYSSNKYAQFSAYNSNDSENTAWMITPAIDLTGKTAPKFKCDIKGGYDNGATLEVFVLTDYDGGDTPWTATASKLSITLPSVPSSGYASDWASSGDMDLSSFSGTIHIAFKYTGGDTGTSKTTTWQIDNINCFE
jgi:hypothetical protein